MAPRGKKWQPLSLLPFPLFFITIAAQTIVETLPGYSGSLPFTLETGYIGVRESEDVQLFYYFIESENDPVKDPLLLWLTGGPGCSGFSGLVYEIGPLKFNFEAYDGRDIPLLLSNPYSWTKVASIIFLDSPAGTGFSYAKSPESHKYSSDDTKAVEDIYSFLQQWLLKHSNFIKNRLYITGDSYAGKWVPMVAWKVSEGNDAELKPRMNLEGYIIGNPLTDYFIDLNSRLPYAHRLALLSDKYYEMAKKYCRGNYRNPEDPWCFLALQHYEDCIENIFKGNILEPACKFRFPRTNQFQLSEILMEDESMRIIQLFNHELWCRNDGYVLSSIWANNPTVQEALHIRKGKVKEWKRCNKTLSFEEEHVQSVVNYHQLLTKKEYQALVYSGDHDLVIPYIGTMEWISQLNLTLDDDWRSWNVDGQVAGYTFRYVYKKRYYLTFATVKGAGHTAPEYKGKECLAMVQRFLSYYSL